MVLDKGTVLRARRAQYVTRTGVSPVRVRWTRGRRYSAQSTGSSAQIAEDTADLWSWRTGPGSLPVQNFQTMRSKLFILCVLPRLKINQRFPRTIHFLRYTRFSRLKEPPKWT